MSSEALDTKSKILQAAIDIIGQKGDFTIREIAEEAGVNVAAINYHFGNKNNLLVEVENHYSSLLYNSQYEILMNSSLKSNEKIALWTRGLIDFMFQCPALIGLIVNLSNEDKSYKPILIQKIYLNTELQRIIEGIIKESTGIEDEKILSYKYLQLFSGVLGPVLSRIVSSTFGEGESSFEIKNNEDLDEYINILVKGVLTN